MSRASGFLQFGLVWISLMLLTRIAWAERVWALPVMTVLAPSERYYEVRGRRPKTLTERAQQMIFQLRRWLPGRPLVVVGDSSYAALELLAVCQGLLEPVTVVTRLRLDAALYEPAPPYSGIGRPCKKGTRLPTPQHVLDSPTTVWTTVEVRWYDGQTRPMEITSGTAVWFHYGKPAVPIRWVLVLSFRPIFCPSSRSFRRWRTRWSRADFWRRTQTSRD